MGGKRSYELMLEIGHKSQPLKTPLPNGYTHKWSIFVRGADNSKIEHCIERVVFQLHDSFPDPQRELTEPPFQIKETGYAGFVIPIYVYFKHRSQPNSIDHKLDLVLLIDRPNSNTTVLKTLFRYPDKDFERCLIKAGARLIPKNKKERSDSPPAKKQKSYSLIPSKDMSKQGVSQAQSHSQISNNNNHSHSSSASLTSQNQVLPSPHAQQKPHHQKTKPSQLNHHGSSHKNHSHANNNNHNSVGNHTSTSLFGNHASHNSNHQNNYQTSKQASQTQPNMPKPKALSRELMDVFGAPLVYNNTKSQKTSNGKDHSSSDNHRDVAFTTTNNRSPIPPVARQPSPQASTLKSHSHHSSNSHHHKSSHHHHHHHKHHQHHVKQEPKETLKTPPPSIPAQVHVPQKISHKQPPPEQVQAPVIQVDPFQVLQSKISSLTDGDRLQRIVDIIEESGEWFNLTSNKFEFDLKRLDKKTLSRIEKCLPRQS